MSFDVYKQNMIMFNNRYAKEISYWSEKIKNINEITFIDHNGNNNMIKKELSIDGNAFESMKKICNNSPLAFYALIVSAFQYVLSRYTGEEKVHILSPILKDDGKIKEINDCVIINGILNPESSFNEFLKNVSKEITLSNRLSNFPVVKIINDFEIENQNYNISKHIVRCKNIHERIIREDFQLLLEIDINEDEILLELFCGDYISTTNVLTHISNVLKEVIHNSNIKLKDINMLSSAEENLLVHFNDTNTEYPKDKTLHELFEEQAEKTPDNISVVFENNKLTYKELNEKANKLARILREKGVRKNDIVGIMVDRSIEMIIAIIAILKAGGAYLPIDPNYPMERITYILEDSQAKILLVQNDNLETISFHGNVINLSNDESYIGSEENLENVNSSSDLAYIIYTSGSTGKPKGTEVMHYNVSRVVKNTNYISICKDDTILQLSNYAFDGSVFDIYGALLNGAKIILMDKETVINMDKLENLIINEKVSIFFVTTALFNTLVDNKIKCFRNIRKILFGGERISVIHARKALEYLGKDKLIHVYGPTESTVFTTYYYINNIDIEAKNIAIGSPISNTEVYITNKNGRLSPIGVPGEINISGDGLVRGYLNRPELTLEKFTSNPFKETGRIYKTGDLGRWLRDGNIEFLGRIDQQVKIRGFRIELGEIEKSLLDNDKIKEAIVIDREDELRNKYLCAYLVTYEKVTVKEIREYLNERLPDYMIPEYFVELDRIPLNNNGKIDKKILPKPDGNINKENQYEAPRNKTENKLAEIWEELLKINKIGINDNFFELGGNSLKSIVLVDRINKCLRVNISISDVFKNNCISSLAKFISNENPSCKDTYGKVKLLKNSNRNNNLIFIHDGSGEIAAYINLVNRLGSNYNYLGIDAEELLMGIPIDVSMEEISRKYVEYIRSFQKEGPYFIAGWSLGGTLAFEICRQLEELGQVVEKVILIDSYISQSESIISFDAKDEQIFLSDLLNIKINRNFNAIEELYEEYEKLICDIKVDNVIKNLSCNENEIYKLITDWNNYDGFEALKKLNLIRTLINANDNYYPIGKVKCSIDFIKATDSVGDKHLIWEEFTIKSVNYRYVKGNHFSIFNEEIEHLADEIQNILK